MKAIKNLALLFIATVIAMNVNAQTTKTVSKEATKTETKSTVEKKKESKEPVKAEAKTETKKDAGYTGAKPRDGRTKTGDPINKSLKGPKGETVYSGPKGGNYYLDKKENKVYIK